MALSRDIYGELEDVVGPENISDDPVIMESYHRPSFEAVILPENTEEVQAIVRLCAKHKIPFKAVSTGWLGWIPGSFPYSGVIYLDLRRMNRIIEINEKNMYAVVEPYVTAAQLQAEVMKRGLNCNVIGAGSNTSALPMAAAGGDGHAGQSTSFGDRNLLAVEWVTPEGEIVGLGSLGSLDEWFCGDGPGPSLRGIIRGQVQPRGGMGVFTKASQKLYHWPGPSTMPVDGVSPNYTLSEMPPNFVVRYFSFTSVEEQIEAERKIGESEIAFEVMGFHVGLLAANISASNEENIENYQQLSKLVQGPGFMIIIAGDSPEDYEYKKRVLEQIISETGGKPLEPIEDPKIAWGLLWGCIRISRSIRETFRAGGLFHNVGHGYGQRDIQLRYMAEVAKKKAVLISKGLIVDDSAYPFGWSLEHGHIGHTELFCQLVPAPESVKAVEELARESYMMAFNGNVAVPPHIPMDIMGPRVCNYHLWIEKVKKAFNPSDLAEYRGPL